MIDKRDLKSSHSNAKHKDNDVINPYPITNETKFDQNTVASVLFGNKKENGDDNNGELSN